MEASKGREVRRVWGVGKGPAGNERNKKKGKVRRGVLWGKTFQKMRKRMRKAEKRSDLTHHHPLPYQGDVQTK